jgi:hypothetical protein
LFALSSAVSRSLGAGSARVCFNPRPALRAPDRNVGRARESDWPRRFVIPLIDDSVFGVVELYPVPSRKSEAGRSGVGYVGEEINVRSQPKPATEPHEIVGLKQSFAACGKIPCDV